MITPVLLAREAFRAAVFARDGRTCVICGAPATDAHHILERRLFRGPDERGGCFLDNGASVCAACHLACERTEIAVEDVRRACGIGRAVVPEHLDADQAYDKWGNPVLADGRRLRGELFDDPSVRKALAEGGVLGLFTDRVKHPRTFHLPWSEGREPGDRTLAALSGLEDEELVVTEKMDGENVSLYRDGLHGRSLDAPGRRTRDWLKNYWASICTDIPEGFRICGENLHARHAVAYGALPSYFLGFSVWRGLTCLDWDETLEWFELLGVAPAPTLWRGRWDEKRLRALRPPSPASEGWVVRPTRAYALAEHPRVVGKFVRRAFVHAVPHGRRGGPALNTLQTG
jgi:hypothetical protein